jgi:hypothetical protein
VLNGADFFLLPLSQAFDKSSMQHTPKTQITQHTNPIQTFMRPSVTYTVALNKQADSPSRSSPAQESLTCTLGCSGCSGPKYCSSCTPSGRGSAQPKGGSPLG